MPQQQTTSPEMREFYEERAAIREHDGKQPKAEAERDAWEEAKVKFRTATKRKSK